MVKGYIIYLSQLCLSCYSQDEDIVSPESLAQVCKNVGLKKDIAEELMASVHDQKIKEKLKEVTEEAVGFGVSKYYNFVKPSC